MEGFSWQPLPRSLEQRHRGPTPAQNEPQPSQKEGEKSSCCQEVEYPAAEKGTEERVAAEKAAVKQAAEKAATKKATAEEAAAGEAEYAASTSCNGRQLPTKESCWNCGSEMSITHQCDIPNAPLTENTAPHVSAEPPLSKGAVSMSRLKAKLPGASAPIIMNGPGAFTPDHQCDTSSVSPALPTPVLRCEETPPSAHLPLCHYCCHLGSGLNLVHYYLQCLCTDKVCTCKCYCSEQQLEHNRQFFPGGFSTNCVDVKDRPRAREVAEERANKLDYKGKPMAQRPCESEACIKM